MRDLILICAVAAEFVFGYFIMKKVDIFLAFGFERPEKSKRRWKKEKKRDTIVKAEPESHEKKELFSADRE